MPVLPDERAVSTTIGYALTLGIATLLITGLLLAGSSFLQNQREETARNELRVIGEQIASDISAADRRARSSGTTTVAISRNLPDDIAGSAYIIVVETSPDERLVLRSADPDVEVEVDFEVESSITSTTLDGRDVEVVWTGGALEVRNE